MAKNQTEEPTAKDYQYGLSIGQGQETTKKCVKCNTQTVHTWALVLPTNLESGEPMLELARRVLLCTRCGNITVTK